MKYIKQSFSEKQNPPTIEKGVNNYVLLCGN